MKRVAFKGQTRQAGSVAIEFSLVAILFFTVVFGTLELARVEFLLNTLEEVTRRAAAAAANVDYTDTTAMQKVQADAVFRQSAGPLPLGDPVTADSVKIDYLSISKATWDLAHMSTLPACPADNRSNCMTDPDGDNCIRFVRARVCASMDDAGSCTPMSYQMVFPFLDLSGMKLPSAETIVPAGSLGATAGAIPCT
jgi:hypothetical protein